MRCLAQAFCNLEHPSRGLPPMPADGEEDPCHSEVWVKAVAEEYERICSNEKMWREVKHSLWWAGVASHEAWDTHVIVNWMDWEHMLGIAF